MAKFIPKSVNEMIEAWDRGDEVQTIEMGGLGDAYEMAIQVVAIELMRAMRDNPVVMILIMNAEKGVPYPEEVFNFLDQIVYKLDEKQEDGSYKMGGLSGAQVSAAKNIALHLTHGGYEKIYTADKDRLIFVAKQDPVTMYEGSK